MYIQYGVTNLLQAGFEFQNSLAWLKAVVCRNAENAQARDLVNGMLDKMSDAIGQLREEFSKLGES